jgi:hypothetical protein
MLIMMMIVPCGDTDRCMMHDERPPVRVQEHAAPARAALAPRPPDEIDEHADTKGAAIDDTKGAANDGRQTVSVAALRPRRAG